MSEILFEHHGLLDSTHNGSALVDNSRFVFMMAMVVDVMLFGGLVGGYLVLRAGTPNWPPVDLPQLHLGIATSSSLCLAITCVFLYLTVRSQYDNELRRMRLGLTCAFVFLLGFLGLNMSEWVHLLSDGLRVRSVFGGVYFVITGAFDLHITAGMLYILLKLRQTLRWTRYTRSSSGIEHLSYYYYTLLGVWGITVLAIYS